MVHSGAGGWGPGPFSYLSCFCLVAIPAAMPCLYCYCSGWLFPASRCCARMHGLGRIYHVFWLVKVVLLDNRLSTLKAQSCMVKRKPLILDMIVLSNMYFNTTLCSQEPSVNVDFPYYPIPLIPRSIAIVVLYPELTQAFSSASLNSSLPTDD